LVNKKQIAGVYEVTFNAENIPSGIYYYSIQAGNSTGSAIFVQTKKMMLLK